MTDPKKNEKGVILVVLLFLVVVAALVGVWGVSTTRMGFLKSGAHRGTTNLEYLAEEGIQKATRRIQEIADPILTDSLFAPPNNAYAAPQLIIDDLVDPQKFPTPSTPGITLNPDCPEMFDPAQDLNSNVIDGNATNVICNFMGTTLSDTQVILVRKDDQVEGIKHIAVFLVNSIARDAAGRRKLMQGVIALPYEGSSTNGYNLPAGQTAYLATMVKSRAQ